MNLNKSKNIESVNTNSDKKSDLKVRVISSIFLLFLLGIYIGLTVLYTEGLKNTSWKHLDIAAYFNLAITICLVSAGAYELLKAMKIGLDKWYYYVGLIFLALLLFIFPFENSENWALYQQMDPGSWNKWYYTFLVIILSIVGIYGIGYFSTGSWKNGALLVIYTFILVIGFKGFTNIALAMSGNNPLFGFNTIIWIWAIIILTDTFAYFGGRKYGKTKMAPTISPKKTWEGSATGSIVAIVFGTLYGCLFFYLLPSYGPLSTALNKISNRGAAWPGVIIFLLSILISFAGQIGDLFFSWYKRIFGVKDFSNLIPGHGGILDRLDSFVFVFFIMYFIALAAQ